jgi:NADH-quinone oxidoreductase subunit N
VAAGSADGVRGVLFYLLAYAFMNVGAFAVACAVERRGEFSSTLADYAGLGRRQPLLAAAMAVFMLSLTGIPPLVGFWGKLYVFRAAVEADLTWLAILGVLNSAVSAFYYLGILVQMYMRDPVAAEGESQPAPLNLGVAIGAAVLLAALVTVALGVWPAPVADLVALIRLG